MLINSFAFRSSALPAHSPPVCAFATFAIKKPFSQQSHTSHFRGDSSTFVSSFYRIDDSSVDLEHYLQRKSLQFRETGDKLIVQECPFCPPIKGKEDNTWKLYLWKDSGNYYCHRCGAQGSYFDLKKRLGDLAEVSSLSGKQKKDSEQSNVTVKDPVIPDQATAILYERNLWTPQFEDTLNYLTDVDGSKLSLSFKRRMHKHSSLKLSGRGLAEEVIRRYRVGAGVFKFIDDDTKKWKDSDCVTFPWIRCLSDSADTELKEFCVDRLKIRSITNKRNQRIDPAGGGWGFFGWHLVRPDDKSIIITEGEFDAMAVNEVTGKTAISLPNGAHSLPVQLLPLLEQFQRIYLWMDDDLAGQEGAEKFARKLGLSRCYLVRIKEMDCLFSDKKNPIQLKPKDANEVLLFAKRCVDVNSAFEQIRSMIDESSPFQHKQIATFTSFRSEIYREFAEPDAIRGVQASSLPRFNSIIKGLRKGELTVLSGPTGVGKTTLLSQLSLDYCQKGVSTLWGSFEIKNTRLAKKMLSQFAGLSLERNLKDFDYWANKFSQLPCYFLRFFGSSNVDQVMDAMEYAVYVHDVEHIVLDNLQFMLGGQMQDRAIDTFRHFAYSNNVHITLVIHPRKESEGFQLGLNSIFGTAKATQEADNVIILQNGDQYRLLEVKKNRFDGELGSVPIVFDRATQQMRELSQEEIDEMNQFGLIASSGTAGGAAGSAKKRSGKKAVQNVVFEDVNFD